MKYLITMLFAAIILQMSACKKNKDVQIIDKTLTGEWKESRSLISNGGGSTWVKTVNENHVLFNTNGTLEGVSFKEFKRYTVKDSVTLIFTGEDKTKYQNYRYKIKGDTLNMSPAGPIYCIEECVYQYIKVK